MNVPYMSHRRTFHAVPRLPRDGASHDRAAAVIAVAASSSGHNQAHAFGFDGWSRELSAACAAMKNRSACTTTFPMLTAANAMQIVTAYARSTFCLWPRSVCRAGQSATCELVQHEVSRGPRRRVAAQDKTRVVSLPRGVGLSARCACRARHPTEPLLSSRVFFTSARRRVSQAAAGRYSRPPGSHRRRERGLHPGAAAPVAALPLAAPLEREPRVYLLRLGPLPPPAGPDGVPRGCERAGRVRADAAGRPRAVRPGLAPARAAGKHRGAPARGGARRSVPHLSRGARGEWAGGC